MHFDFTDEQKLFRDASRKFLQDQCPPTYVRQMMEHETTHQPRFWNQLVELGWTGMLIPEAHGGVEGTLTDMVVVAEEIGRAVMPGPFYATSVTGATLLSGAGTGPQKETYLSRMAEGTHLTTLAVLEQAGTLCSASIHATAEHRKGRYVLSGEKLFVPDAHVADSLIVAARTTRGSSPGRGVSLFLVDRDSEGLTVEQMPAVDASRRICRVALEGVALPQDALLGDLDGAWPLVERAVRFTHVPYCCELVGLAERTLEMVVEYLGVRVQFDRPIGTFQALQHRCADIMVHNELAKSLAYYACYAVEKDLPDASVALAMAQSYCSESTTSTISDGIQLFGGIGFTWEHDIHLYQRRALSLSLNMGGIQHHRERVAAAFLD